MTTHATALTARTVVDASLNGFPLNSFYNSAFRMDIGLPIMKGMDRGGLCSTRPAVEHDLDALSVLLQACIDHMRVNGIDQWDDVYPTRATLLADIQSGAAYVATLPGPQLVGYIVLNEHQDAEYASVGWSITEAPIAVVHRLMVRPADQRRGLARFLMQFVEQRARALGYKAIRLDAFTTNPRALHLYEGLGYRDAGGVTLRKGPFRCFEKALVGAETSKKTG